MMGIGRPSRTAEQEVEQAVEIPMQGSETVPTWR